MKKLDKKEAPLSFSEYVTKHAPKTWEDVAPVRTALREHIWKEQGCCCAYTEIRLEADACHIDHYRKRNLFPELTLDYTNMLVACNAESYSAKHKDKTVTCKADYDNLINPLVDNPSDYLEFTWTGTVCAVGQCKKGEQTISYFNLNERSLRERRKTALLQMKTMLDDDLAEEDIVEAFGEFESMIRQLYKDNKN